MSPAHDALLSANLNKISRVSQRTINRSPSIAAAAPSSRAAGLCAPDAAAIRPSALGSLCDLPGAQTQLALAEEKVNLIATVPSHKKLQIRTIRDIANALDAKIVYNER